jgi:hypothetical protein
MQQQARRVPSVGGYVVTLPRSRHIVGSGYQQAPTDTCSRFFFTIFILFLFLFLFFLLFFYFLFF